MGLPPVKLGEPLLDDSLVFRAFALDGHRRKNKVRPRAYYRSIDHTDGVSVGLTPKDAVSRLDTNHGYCHLPVGPVHQLPHDLRICPDLNDIGHAIIANIPFIDGTDEEREQAELIAGKLARLSVVITNEFVDPNSL
jgi:hypothetical protein